MHTRLLTLASLTLAFSASALSQTPQQYTQTNLVSSAAGKNAVTVDPQLNGVWGISVSSSGPWWVADTATGLSTLYNGAGAKEGLVVKVPSADPSTNKPGLPTGIVFNASASDFILPDGKAASFIFDTIDGTIAGWNGSVANNTAETVVNQGPTSVFTGLAVAQATVNGVTAPYLYAADNGAGKLSVFDTHFQHATTIEDAIASIGKIAGFSPFGVQNLGGTIYVALDRADGTLGAGQGAVVAITPEGKLVGFLQDTATLNAPWGIAEAPGNFGQYSHDLLVGNNGDGKINVFNPQTGKFIATLVDAKNNPIVIPGLWGLSFGNDTVNGGLATSLFFAADLNGAGGLFGTLTPVQNTFGSDN